jgi:hypothetical protein
MGSAMCGCGNALLSGHCAHCKLLLGGKIQTLLLYLDQKERSFGFSNRKLTKVLRFQGWIKEHRFACFPLLHKQGDRYINVSSEEEALSTVLV